MASSDAVPGSSVVGQTLPRPETEPEGTAGTMAAPIRPAGRRGRYRLRGVSAAGAAVLVALLVTMQLRGGAAHSVFFELALPAADLRQLSAFEVASGCQPSVFAQSVKLDSPSFTVAALNDISSAGMTPFLTLEPWSFRSVSGQAEQPQYALRTIIRGDHDGPLLAVADVLAAYGKPVYLRFAHEMNAHWYPWGEANGNSPGEYVMAWRHVHRLLGALDPQISWVWSPAAVQQTRVTARLASLYPGDDYVNFVGAPGMPAAATATAMRLTPSTARCGRFGRSPTSRWSCPRSALTARASPAGWQAWGPTCVTIPTSVASCTSTPAQDRPARPEHMSCAEPRTS